MGQKLEDPRPVNFTKQGDLFGWHRQFDGRSFLGLYVEAGRIKDLPGYELKTALRKIVQQFRPEVRLTPSQNLILANVKELDREAITKVLAEHGVPVENQASIVRRASMACVALPTCGLSLAESERALPGILSHFEGGLKEVGLEDQEIIIRMTGCPNGCARPFMAEIGFVGRAPNKYQVYLGGNESATRLNRLWKENVKGEDLLPEIKPLLTRYKQERLGAERFGDWVARVLWAEQSPQSPTP